jgi:2-keto-4-pentenoate hydratase
MKKAELSRVVAILADAWQIGNPIIAFPEECCPRTARDGMQIQDALVRELGVAVGGWKIGCTSEYARKLLRTKGPIAGRVLAPRIFASGASLPGSAYRMRGLEGEFAFVLGKDLKPRKRPYTRSEVRAAVAEVRPAVELVDSRFLDWLSVSTPCLIADMGCNAALVLGNPIKRWKTTDLTKAAVRMKVDGKVVGEGKGGDALGDPFLALAWLANQQRTRDGLKAGQVVTTGTCTGFHKAEPAAKVEADFGRLGKVSFTLVKTG